MKTYILILFVTLGTQGADNPILIKGYPSLEDCKQAGEMWGAKSLLGGWYHYCILAPTPSVIGGDAP